MLRRPILVPVKRLAQIIGLIGGAAAIVWAMRDRFISVATSREPQPPTFRSDIGPSLSVETVQGIGPAYAARLEKAGITNTSILASRSADAVAEAAGVSVARARQWIELASQL